MSEAFELTPSASAHPEGVLDESKVVYDAIRLARGEGRIAEVEYPPETGSKVNWRDVAACRDLDTNLFFPPGDGAQAQEQIEKAKEICGKCVVADDCLEFALITRQDYGVWGGKTEKERRSIRRAKRRQT